MGLMKEKDILNFISDLCYGIYMDGDFDLNCMTVRYGCYEATLSDVNDIEDIEPIENLKAAFIMANESLEIFREDKYVDVYLSCEGDFYEQVFLSETEGDDTYAGYIIDSVTLKYGLTVELCDGGLGFQCKESWDLQRKDEGWL